LDLAILGKSRRVSSFRISATRRRDELLHPVMRTHDEKSEARDERLSFMSRVLKGKRRVGPRAPSAEHGVKDGQQFVHASDQSQLFGFTSSKKILVMRFQNGIMSRAYQRRHVECFASYGPASADHASATELPAVAIDGRHADQSGDLVSRGGTQLGQLGSPSPVALSTSLQKVANILEHIHRERFATYAIHLTRVGVPCNDRTLSVASVRRVKAIVFVSVVVKNYD